MSLSTEIRTLIWEEVVGWCCVHILEDTFVRCNSSGLKPGHTINDCHRHRNSTYLSCPECPKSWSVGVAGVCWLFYDEVSALMYRKTLLCFANSRHWTNFIQTRLESDHPTGFSLRHLRRIQIEMGAAKHNPVLVNAQNRAVLRQLAEEATNLEVLNLNFTYYHRGESDKILLNREILRCILLFRQLKDLNLKIHQIAPGPLGIPSLNEATVSKVLMQWKSLELILQTLTCQSSAFEISSGDCSKEQELVGPIVSRMSRRNVRSLHKAVRSLLLRLAEDA